MGSMVTAMLFSAGRSLVGIYLEKSALGVSAGAASSLVIVLIWVYVSSLMFLLGAKIGRVTQITQLTHHARNNRLDLSCALGREFLQDSFYFLTFVVLRFDADGQR